MNATSSFELIEISSVNDLPKGVEMVEYGPPFYGDALQVTASEFKAKYGNHPQTIYQLGKRLWVVKP